MFQVWQLYHGDSFDLQEFRNMPLRVLCLKNSASTGTYYGSDYVVKLFRPKRTPVTYYCLSCF